MLKAIIQIILFACLVILPVLLATFFNPESENLLHELGRNCALMGFVLLMLQVVLAARIKWIERPFGFDILIRYHKHMGIFAGFLLLVHPLLLAAGSGSLHLLTGLDLPWYIWAGRAALLIVLINIGLSYYQETLKLKFEKWRFTHDVLGPLILATVFVHSWITGDDLVMSSMRILWILALAAATLIFAGHRFLRPYILKRNSYRVTEVKPEADDVWTVKLTPPEGKAIYEYLPGQFQFITFFRNRNLPVEEHHWTISSSPAETGYVSSTIKALGDFTSTIGQTQIGDRAAVHAPFGRFSYALHQDEKELVFLAGGIGITPLMSMLRHMRDVEDGRTVILVYANKKENQIVFRQELSDIENGKHPQLKIIHVLSDPDDDWEGETGLIDREKIERLTGELPGKKVFYVCGPPPMLNAVISTLKDLRVPDAGIRAEIFSFLD